MGIYVVRHGQDEDNRDGILNGYRNRSLTSLGYKQAEELAEHIKELGITFDEVLSSPLFRAYFTGKAITNKLGLPNPKPRDFLIERNFGIMTGKPVKDIEKLCKNILKTNTITYFLDPEGAETFPDMIKRAQKVFDYLRGNYAESSKILLATHGDFGKMLYTAYYGLDWMDTLKNFHFGNGEMLLMSPDSSAEDTHVFKVEQFNH